MLDMEDVRQDLSEHFGVVGDRIGRSFSRSQPTYLQYSEADYLITPSQQQQVVTVSRVKTHNYGTVNTSVRRASDTKKKPEVIGKDNKNKYRIAKIEDKDSPGSSGQGSSQNTLNSTMTQSTASTSSSFGINVKGLENDPINYRNPDV